MRCAERGFTVVETVVATAIMAAIVLAASMTIYQSISVTRINNNDLTATRQVQNAGYWITRDAQMAERVITDNLSSGEFLLLTWTEWEYDSAAVFHSVTYHFEELSGGVGTLMRNHWSSEGANDETLVARYIAYDPGDPANTSNISYQKPVLNFKIKSLFDGNSEIREYRINRRVNV